MKNRSDRRHFTSLSSLVLISAFIIAVAVGVAPFYSVRSSSLPTGGSSLASVPSGANENVNQVGSLTASALAPRVSTFQSEFPNKFGVSPINGSYSGPGLMALAAFLDDESIAVSPPITRAPGCTNPAVMCLGETVSAQVVNAPLRVDFRERRIQWIAPDGTVPHMWTVDENPENDTYTLETMGLFAQVGTWTVRTVNNRGGGVAVATFEVGDPTQPSVDLALSMSGPATVAANDTPTYIVTLTNGGPDAAANVVLTNPVPSNSTFASASPASGFSCTTPAAGQGGDIECTAASLAVGVPAVFSFTFTANSDVNGGTSVFNVAKVGSSTNEPNTSNNIAYVGSNSADSGAGEGPCTLTCRLDVVVTANTTQGGDPGRFVSYSAASANGNCGAISNSPGSGSFFAVAGSPHTVTSTATEGPSCTFAVTVLSSTPPTISCPAAITVTAASGEDHATLPDGPGLPTHTASGGGETVVGVRSDGIPATYDDDGNVLTQAVVVPLTAPYPVGTTGILWTVTDAAGRTASCSQSITVQAVARDVLTISCPANINATAPAGNCEATVALGVPTTNPSDSHVTVIGVRSDGEPMYDCDQNGANCTRKTPDLPFPAGVTVITWTATDDVNDSVASCTQTVTVSGNDTTAPTLHLPDIDGHGNPNISVTTSSCSATLDDELGVATAEDNCTPSVNVVRTGVPANFVFPTGTTIITYTATDASGNTASATQLVTVHELTPPTITAPASLLTGLNTGGVGGTSCGTVVNDATLGTATANDNCPGVTIARSGVPVGNDFPVGDTIITYTATDASLNTAQAFQTIRVADNTPPTITLIGANPQYVECHTSYPELGATANDNCTASFAATPSGTVDVNTPGTYTINYNASDSAGNPAAQASRTVIVRDTIAPTMTLNSYAPSMWPPNHKYQTFGVAQFVTGASDSCDTSLGIGDVVIEKVTSDEIENGNGDGNTFNDIVIAADCRSVQLRAERDGGGNGRIYTITFRVRDASGNTTRATAKVVVQHNPGETVVDSGVHYTVMSSCP